MTRSHRGAASLLALLALCAAASAVRATTIGGATGNASADARPFVWKSRDGGEPVGDNRHYLSLVKGRTHRYLGVHPSDADPRMGVNERGLAFGNCTAHAFKRSRRYAYANTQALKQHLLGETASLEEARSALRANTLGDARDWPQSVALMAGIFDALGRLALWEVGDGVLREYDPSDPRRRAQLRWEIYARDNRVHDRDDHRDDPDQRGRRYRIPQELLLEAAARGGAVPGDFVAAARAGEAGVDGGEVPSRDKTSAAMIAHGVLAGEDPRIVTMWNALGQPDYAPFVPVWVAVGDALSPRIATNHPETSLSGASERLWRKNDRRGYDAYINRLLAPMEANFFAAVEAARERWLRSGFRRDEALRIHREASETAWHTLTSLAAGSGRQLNVPPELIGLDAQVDGLRVRFTAEARDPDGRIVAWDWDFGDGMGAQAAAAAHTYASPGRYLVRVRVSDDGGARNSRWRYVVLGPEQALPLVTVAAEPAGRAFRLRRQGASGAELRVPFVLSGPWRLDDRAEVLEGEAVLPAGAGEIRLLPGPLVAGAPDPERGLTLTLGPGEGYRVGAPANATLPPAALGEGG